MPGRPSKSAAVAIGIGLLLGAQLHAPRVFAGEGWRWSASAEFSSEFNDNVFGLDADTKDRVRNQDPVDRANGRLRDMESVDDFILIPRVEVTAKTFTPLGRLSISPRFAFHRYIENDAKSFSDFELRVRQSLPDRSSLRLSFGYTLDAFKRNYLRSTIGTGSVSSSERVYDRGRYDDWGVELSYERRLWHRKSRDQPVDWPTTLEGEILGGYGQRRFDNGFSNRNRDVWRGGLALRSDFGDTVDLQLSYRFSDLNAPGDDEILILDEPELGINLNGDADLLDNNVRIVAPVDRSREEHRIGIKVKVRPLQRIRSWVAYDYALRNYDSDGALDFAYRDRRDDVHGVRVGARWKFTKVWSTTVEGRFDLRDVNRDANVVGDEDAKKREKSVRLSVGRKF